MFGSALMLCFILNVSIDEKGIYFQFPIAGIRRKNWSAIKKVSGYWPTPFFMVSNSWFDFEQLQIPAPWIADDEKLYWNLINRYSPPDCPLRKMFRGRNVVTGAIPTKEAPDRPKAE
jgi:hypothetical protein